MDNTTDANTKRKYPRPHCTNKSGEVDMKRQKFVAMLSDSAVMQAFQQYQVELDTRNDKFERIVKVSRDITTVSKRAIFGLLRKGEMKDILVADAQHKVNEIEALLHRIGTELVNEDVHQYQRAFTNGVQEFIEFVSLLQFIRDGTFLTYTNANRLYFNGPLTTTEGLDTSPSEEIATPLTCADNTLISFLLPRDYILGIADLTGELMRLAINSIGGGEREMAFTTVSMLRRIHQEFGVFVGTDKFITQKASVMRTSLQKVEAACYAVQVR